MFFVPTPSIVPRRPPFMYDAKTVDVNTEIEMAVTQTEVKEIQIYFTIDGTKPTPFVPIVQGSQTFFYSAPVKLPLGKVTIKAIAVQRDLGMISHMITKTFKVVQKLRPIFSYFKDYDDKTPLEAQEQGSDHEVSDSSNLCVDITNENKGSEIFSTEFMEIKTLSDEGQHSETFLFDPEQVQMISGDTEPYGTIPHEPFQAEPNKQESFSDQSQKCEAFSAKEMDFFSVDYSQYGDFPFSIPADLLETFKKKFASKQPEAEIENKEKTSPTKAVETLKSIQYCVECSQMNSINSKCCISCNTVLYKTCYKCNGCSPLRAFFCQVCGEAFKNVELCQPKTDIAENWRHPVIDENEDMTPPMAHIIESSTPSKTDTIENLTDKFGNVMQTIFKKEIKSIGIEAKPKSTDVGTSITPSFISSFSQTGAELSKIKKGKKYSAGKGFWRQQVNYICDTFKIYTNNTMQFQKQMSQPILGQLISVDVKKRPEKVFFEVVFERVPKCNE